MSTAAGTLPPYVMILPSVRTAKVMSCAGRGVRERGNVLLRNNDVGAGRQMMWRWAPMMLTASGQMMCRTGGNRNGRLPRLVTSFQTNCASSSYQTGTGECRIPVLDPKLYLHTARDRERGEGNKNSNQTEKTTRRGGWFSSLNAICYARVTEQSEKRRDLR